MKKLIAPAIVLALAIVATGLTVASGGRPRVLSGPAPKAVAKAMPPLVMPPEKSVNPFRVVPLPTAGGPTRDLHARLGEQLARLRPLPRERADHFAWLLDHAKDVYFLGWNAFVEDATPTPSGYIVTLRVSPQMGSTRGNSVTVTDHLIERYELADGNWKFLGAVESPNAVRTIFTD
jgi:hypothetical protein